MAKPQTNPVGRERSVGESGALFELRIAPAYKIDIYTYPARSSRGGSVACARRVLREVEGHRDAHVHREAEDEEVPPLVHVHKLQEGEAAADCAKTDQMRSDRIASDRRSAQLEKLSFIHRACVTWWRWRGFIHCIAIHSNTCLYQCVYCAAKPPITTPGTGSVSEI
jgi:hypothetical protein